MSSILLGADPNAASPQESISPALHQAIRYERPDIVEALLVLGANPTLIDGRADSYGMTPIHYASLYGQEEALQMLLAAGADLEARDKFGCTALSIAVSKDNAHIVKKLLQNGADANACDNKQQTPMHVAATRCRADIAQLLAAHGGKLDVKDVDGWTPLGIAKVAKQHSLCLALEALRASREGQCRPLPR